MSEGQKESQTGNLGPPKRTRTIDLNPAQHPFEALGPAPANLYGGVGPAFACFRSWSAGGTAANGALRWRTIVAELRWWGDVTDPTKVGV